LKEKNQVYKEIPIMKTGHQYSSKLGLVVRSIYIRLLLYNFVCLREAVYLRSRSLWAL